MQTFQVNFSSVVRTVFEPPSKDFSDFFLYLSSGSFRNRKSQISSSFQDIQTDTERQEKLSLNLSLVTFQTFLNTKKEKKIENF